MLSFIFNQFDLGFPGGGLVDSTGQGRRGAVLEFPPEMERDAILAIKARSRLRSFRYPQNENPKRLRRVAFRFPEELFTRSAGRRRGLEYEAGARVVKVPERSRSLRDPRSLFFETGRRARSFTIGSV